MAQVIVMVICLCFFVNIPLCLAGDNSINFYINNNSNSYNVAEETAKMVAEVRSWQDYNNDLNTVNMPQSTLNPMNSNFTSFDNNSLQNSSFFSGSDFNTKLQNTLPANSNIVDNTRYDKEKTPFGIKSKNEFNYEQKTTPIYYKETDTYSAK